MMLIANPIYDVVFKYLMEDLDIAKELLSQLLGLEITHLEPKPQETTAEIYAAALRLYRLDYKATIRTDGGETKNVTIEMQKAKDLFDIMRFRKYLGKQYTTEETITQPEGQQIVTPLPIFTIYFLGFSLDHTPVPVTLVKRGYYNAATGEKLETPKESFIELLTHDSLVVQIKLLAGQIDTKMERLLQIFNQTFAIGDKHTLDYTLTDETNPLVQKMLRRLGTVVANEKIQQEMEIEDEMDRTYFKKLGEKDKIIEEQEVEIGASHLREKEARRQKEEAQKREEEAQKTLALTVKFMHKTISIVDIAAMLGKSETEISALLEK